METQNGTHELTRGLLSRKNPKSCDTKYSSMDMHTTSKSRSAATNKSQTGSNKAIRKENRSLVLKKSMRRYNKNEGKWQTIPPKLMTLRTESSLSKSIKNFQSKSTSLKKGAQGRMSSVYHNLKDNVRRATKSGNDPFVKVTILPTTGNLERSFRTSTIFGGGSHVQWNYGDENEHTFLLRDDAHALQNKYLKIEVFDYETGVNNRSLGVATIVTQHLSSHIDEKHYATLDLYSNSIESGYGWAGTVEISAMIKKISLLEVVELTKQINDEKEKKLGIRKGHFKGLTESDQLVLDGNVSTGKKDSFSRSQMHLKLIGIDQAEKDKAEQHKNSVQGMVINFVLFLSLIMIGTLFFGVMNLHEVEEQTVFIMQRHGTEFSIIDALGWTFTTVTTLGYGYFYPLTRGGRIFASIFIVFGVSLLGRLLHFLLDRITHNFVHKRNLRRAYKKSLTFDNLSEWDADGDGKVSNYEFLVGMLLRRNDTKLEVIQDIMALFDKYDMDQSGEIEMDELKENMAKNTKEMIDRIAKEEQTKKDNRNKTFMERYCACCGCCARGSKSISNVQDDDVNDLIIDENDCDLEFDADVEFEYALVIEVRGCDHLKEADDLIDYEDNLHWFLFGLMGFICYLLLGAKMFSYVEDGDFGDYFWFCMVTTFTVGYGDIYPQTKEGKILNAFFISLSVVLFVVSFGNAFDFIYKRQEMMVNKHQTKDHIGAMEQGINDMIDWCNCKRLRSVLDKNEMMRSKRSQLGMA